MISLQTYSESGVFIFDGGSNTAFKIAGPCEVSKLKLSALAAPAFVSIYDAADASGAIPSQRKWFLDAGVAACDSDVFPNPLTFKRGVYAICEDGGGSNPQLGIATIPSQV